MTSLEDSIARVVDSLPAVELAVVFGSTARGTAGPASDVDIGLVLADDSLRSRQEASVALGRALGREVDIIYLDEAPPQLRFEIARHGRCIIERSPGVWARFRGRAMIDWWDWAPTARRMHAAAIDRLRRQVGHGGS